MGFRDFITNRAYRRRQMYDLLLDLCDSNTDSLSNVPGKMIALDRARAQVDLLSPRFLCDSNPALYILLEACNKAEVLLPEDRLRQLLDHFMPLAHGDCFPNDHIVAAGLMAYARVAGEKARLLAMQAIGGDNPQVKEYAADCLAFLAGVRDPMTVLWERMDKHGIESLDAPQRVVLHANWFDREVSNGGIIQFFDHTSGDYVPETLDALRAIGHPEALTALEKAIEILGPSSLSRAEAERLGPLEGRFEELGEAFAPLESALFKTLADFRVREYMYVVEHAEHFRPAEAAAKPRSRGM